MEHPRTVFMTEIGLASVMYSLVPFDAELQGVSELAGSPMFVWTTRMGVGPTQPKRRVEFYAVFCGGQLPDDAGDLVATIPTTVEIDGEQVEAEALIFEKKEVMN